MESSDDELETAVKQLDVFRETPIRLLGYANEVGEAFRSLIRVRWVHFSYAIASSYVFADTLDKSHKCHKKYHSFQPDQRRTKVTTAAVDTLLWQSFASVIIPGFTINRLCALSGYLLNLDWPDLLHKLRSTRTRASSIPASARKWTTTAIGLAAIPFIVKPIDTGVDYVMDRTCRPLYMTHEDIARHDPDVTEHHRAYID